MSIATYPRPTPDGGPVARSFLVAILASAGLVAFVGMRPSQPWVLFFTAGVVALAAAGTVRGRTGWSDRPLIVVIGFTLLPVVSTLAAGAFADRVVDGYARPAAAVGGGVIAGITVLAEYRSMDPIGRAYGLGRVVLAVATYAAAFCVFAVMFQSRVDTVSGALAVGVVSWLLATSLLREAGTVGVSGVLAGFAVGVSLTELRAVLYFFPIDGVLGGAVLLIGFHVATGIVHHLLDHDLGPMTLAEYGLVAAAGLGAVTVGAAVG